MRKHQLLPVCPTAQSDPFESEPQLDWNFCTVGALTRIAGLCLCGTAFPLCVCIAKCSSTFHGWAAARFTHILMPLVHHVFAAPWRAVASAGCRGRVLDVGCGHLPHLELYKSLGTAAVTEVVACEPNPHCHAVLEAKAAATSELKISVSAEYLAEQETASFDCVVLSFVMCEIPEYQKVPEDVLRVLKPGGCCIFAEHIGAPVGSLTRKFQDQVSGAWCFCTDGCNLNRHQKSYMEKQSWAAVFTRTYDTVVPVYIGLAVKEGSSSC